MLFCYIFYATPGDVVERTAGQVELHEVDASALKLLVDYAYTGEIAITEDNVQVKEL